MARPANERVKRRRELLRAQGLRPIQIWVPDTRSPGFAEQCRQQSMLLLEDPQEHEILEWIEDLADQDDWQ